LQSSFANKR